MSEAIQRVHFDVLTLFPEAIREFVSSSIIGRAQAAGLVNIVLTDIRDFARDRHRSVDDRPFGGGPGMVLSCGPVFEAVEQIRSLDASDSNQVTGSGLDPAAKPAQPMLIMLTPQGERFSQKMAISLARQSRIVLLCGHYEGFDERIREGLSPVEISIGDYVLSGGEAAAMVVIDAVVRLLPGVLGCDESNADESFSAGLLEYPQYTRPREFRGMNVPDVLVSGDHAAVDKWRRDQALARTRRRRPDLLDGRDLQNDCDDPACDPD